MEWILVFLVCWIILSGLDDLFLLGCYIARGRLGRRRPPLVPEPALDRLRPAPQRRIAVFIPLWQEQAVIARMLEHNLGAIHYRNYDVFAGVYPNDPATTAVVASVAARFPRVHVSVCPHDGPTSKADCLNWIYQTMLLQEEKEGARFDIVLMHDAEDVIHPDSLLVANHYTRSYEMVQTPVFPLATPFRCWTHGFYCDDFAEFHLKDMPVRSLLGGFVPSSGVGTSYSRSAIDMLAADGDGRIFRPEALTEDYESGLRLHQLGCAQIFLAWRGGLATREYFPLRFRAALRQRTRWVTGIALQGWQRHGWNGGRRGWYWLWRDRKGLIGNPAALAANILFLYGLLAAGPTHPLLLATACLAGVQLGARAWFTSRVYGWRFALGTPLRVPLGNLLNSLAALRALWQFSRASVARRPLAWLKTEHAFPAAGLAVTIEPRTVAAGVARSLPARAVRELGVLPVSLQDGRLRVAVAELPGDQLRAKLRRFTRLPVEFTLVTPPSFEHLCRQLL